MQQEKADIILLPGDIMDDDIAAYTAENMKPHLAKLRAPLGVYATLGNHDYFINPKPSPAPLKTQASPCCTTKPSQSTGNFGSSGDPTT